MPRGIVAVQRVGYWAADRTGLANGSAAPTDRKHHLTGRNFYPHRELDWFMNQDKLSKMDLFAAHALAGLLASPAGVDKDFPPSNYVADLAFGYAEAMLAESERRAAAARKKDA